MCTTPTKCPAYDLPDNKTRSVIKTRSSEKGTADNFNELRFEDKKDSEEVYFHAEKDFNRVVENNDTLKVGFDKRTTAIRRSDIYNNRTTTLDTGNETLTVKKGTRTVTVKGDDKHQVQTGNPAVQVDQGNASLQDLQQLARSRRCNRSSLQGRPNVRSKLTPTGVTIQSTMIKLQASGMLQSQGGFHKISGDSLVEVQGGMVKIN